PPLAPPGNGPAEEDAAPWSPGPPLRGQRGPGLSLEPRRSLPPPALPCSWPRRRGEEGETTKSCRRPPSLPGTPTRAAFSHWAGGSRGTRQRQAVEALLQHQHSLRLARHYCLRLKAASDFVRRLMEAEGRPSTEDGGAPLLLLLRSLCQELRGHASHWGCLQCHLRRDPRLRPLLLGQAEALRRMKGSLQLLALQALCLLERGLEALLQRLAPGPPAPLWEAFRALESYNQALSEWGSAEAPGQRRAQQAFSAERVLAILAAERGRLAGQRLSQGLPWRQAGTSEGRPTAGGDPSGPADGLPGLLWALYQEEEEAIAALLPGLLASTGGPRHRLLHRPKWGHPQAGPPAAQGLAPTPLPSWEPSDGPEASLAQAAAMLCTEYRPLFWKAASASWLQLQALQAQSPGGAGAALGQRVTDALEQAALPAEAVEALRDGALGLLERDAVGQWDVGFCRTLGASLVDRCVAKPTPGACSRTGQELQSLLGLLTSRLRRLGTQPLQGGPGQCLAPAGLPLRLLPLVVATCHACSYWTLSRACQHLAAWSLGPFLLVAQGDLQLLKTGSGKMLVLVSRACLENPRASHWERELGLQVQSAAASIQLFEQEALASFCVGVRRVSAEVFGQAMPLGKYWRLALQAEPPSAASEYAQAAAQAVLAPVLQGVQGLSQDSQALVLSQATTAFLEVWMEHILAQKVRFSLQGALQLKRDFDLVREALQSEEHGLPPEVKRLVLSLWAFQEVDNAVACLLQQPSKCALYSRPWGALHKCCSRDGGQSWHGSPGSLSNLEHLEGLPVQGRAGLDSWAADLLSRASGGGPSSETYLNLAQREWLALRLHGARPWRMPALSCLSHPAEA
ncbi:coiled-coil domain-containing protein 142, partial [Erythrolamprus reginae]|uniref:coiled-coil domain-containing protein 142 n=1 Tax=Erythrolamprus reginae TaxID=121349 RepID=UPI00396CA4D0